MKMLQVQLCDNPKGAVAIRMPWKLNDDNRKSNININFVLSYKNL